jgi:hypothetical protein
MKLLLLLIPTFAILSCQNNNVASHELSDKEMQAYTRPGDSIVKITFNTLRNTLLSTIGKDGIAGAVRVCNVKAKDITSLYSQQDITVLRLSGKPRNPANKPGVEDSIIWNKYLEMAARHDSMRAMVVAHNSELHYYKPILVQPLCLNCHGQKGKEITPGAMHVIDSLYPPDMATGYKTGDLRGLWHLVFKNRQAK